MYNFYAYLSRMKYIERWSLMKSTTKENILEHTAEVTFIAHSLCLIAKRVFNKEIDETKVLTYALYHETSEVITGDLPTPIKYYNPAIKTAYKNIESIANEKLLSMLPDCLKEDYASFMNQDTECYEYRLSKAADKISALIKCIEECKIGNAEFKKAKEGLYQNIMENPTEEVKYFMDNFIQSYSLTLDELD